MFFLRAQNVLGGPVRRYACVALACLIAAVLLAACEEGPQPTATEPPTAVPTPLPSNTPMATPVPTMAPPPTATSPAPTPSPTATSPAPTPSPMPSPSPTPQPTPLLPTPAPVAGGVDADHDFDIDSGTLWGELFDTLIDSEQSCISRELGSELLASVRERPVMSGGETYQWEVQIFGCVTPETAATLVFASLAEDFGELSEGDETCLRDLLVGIDLADMLAGSLPDASPESAAAAELFSLVLLGCVAGAVVAWHDRPNPVAGG